MECTIRMIEDRDIERTLEIYGPYILNTPITFEYTVPSIEEFTDRVHKIQIQYPWLVCEVDGEIAGYAYAGSYRARMAFSWDAELSVYLDPKFQGLHIGRFLYERLIALLRAQGYYNLYALISVPNEKSVALHQHLGFEEEGLQRGVGFKLGKWRDLLLLVKPIRERECPVMTPTPISQFGKELIEEILAAGI